MFTVTVLFKLCIYIYAYIHFKRGLKCILSSRIVENGQERVEVEEDGQLKSLTINGKEHLLRLDNK